MFMSYMPDLKASFKPEMCACEKLITSLLTFFLPAPFRRQQQNVVYKISQSHDKVLCLMYWKMAALSPADVVVKSRDL